jgi:muramoyltetrapeptide carboxypeptidase
MLRPLTPGATLGIAAPAGAVKSEKLEAATKRLRERGFKLKLSEHVFGKHGFLSATDEIRAAEFSALFSDPEIDLVLCARGGVGSSRLLPRLNFEQLAISDKPFIGFSDLTAIQWALWGKHRAVTFSGPLAIEFDGSLSADTESFMFDMLADTAPENWLSAFPLAVLKIVRGGASEIFAPLMPGNLTMIATLLGTPYMPDIRGSILAMEDVAEPPYRVDRLLFHLQNAGLLQNLAALLVGDFGWEPDDQESRERLYESVLDATSGTSYPVIFGLPYGHGPERLTLPVGSPVRLSLKPSAISLGFAVSPFALPA